MLGESYYGTILLTIVRHPAFWLGLLWIISVLICSSILRKAGFSKWWVVALLFPYSFLLFPLFLAFRQWPIHRELSYYRLLAGQGNDDDAQEVLERGMRLMVKGERDKALYCFNQVALHFKDKPAGRDAEIQIKAATNQA